MRLLLVEDEENIVWALKTGFERDGFDLDVATEGATGLWKATENLYGVILLDLMLPEIDGITVCRTLRERGINTPVLMLTALAADSDVVQGLAIGADDYLTKPFSYQVLREQVRALLRRQRADSVTTDSNCLSVGSLEMYISSKTVIVAGKEIQLTRREFMLLETLALASGRVLSKQYLLDQVWGDSFEGAENVVEVYIRYLRRKLAPAGCAGFIQTVRGSGYRLRE